MTAREAISHAEAVLQQKTRAARAGQRDPRWYAIIQVGEFIERDPNAVWSFIRTWGRSKDGDLRMAVATCLLEHLLEHHFDRFIAVVEEAALDHTRFADTVSHCWKFGQAEDSGRAARLDRLIAASRQKSKRLPRSQRFTPDTRGLGQAVAVRAGGIATSAGEPRSNKPKSSRKKARKHTA
jgi:hypothetical protein